MESRKEQGKEKEDSFNLYLSVRQVKRIVYQSEEKLFKHIDK